MLYKVHVYYVRMHRVETKATWSGESGSIELNVSFKTLGIFFVRSLYDLHQISIHVDTIHIPYI